MRTLALVVLLLGLTAPLDAQTRYGARAGFAFATLQGDFELQPAYRTRTGFSAGAMGRIPLRGPFAVQGEVLYVQAGGRIDGAAAAAIDGESDADRTVELTYIEVPLLGVLEGLGTRDIGLRLHAGPSIGFEFGEVLRVEGTEQTVQPALFISPNVSVAAGADLEFMLSGQRTVLGARYTYGLTDLADGIATDAAGNAATVHSRVLTVSLGVFL